MRTSSMIFKRRSDRFSPSKMAIVSLPTMRSPCMSRTSKKAVLTNTIPAAHKKINTVTQWALSDSDSGGRRAVTIPQATAIINVFDPGISLNRLYLSQKMLWGTNLRLYDSPSRLNTRSSKNGKSPRVKAITRPALPAARARIVSRMVYLL